MKNYEQVWTSLNKSEQVWTSLNKSEQVLKSLDKSKQVMANHGETIKVSFGLGFEILGVDLESRFA
jgi:hypothetical protein